MLIISVRRRNDRNNPKIVYRGWGGRHRWKGSPLKNPFKDDADWVAKYRAHLRDLIDAADPAVVAAMNRVTADSWLACRCHVSNYFDPFAVVAANNGLFCPDAAKKCHTEIVVEEWVRWRQDQRRRAERATALALVRPGNDHQTRPQP